MSLVCDGAARSEGYCASRKLSIVTKDYSCARVEPLFARERRWFRRRRA